MNALVFLGVALAISLIGSLVVLARNRNPRSIETGIDDFTERMKALSPESPHQDQSGD
ncbi:MAG TPA: hypothetical protein VJM33_01515 [Microthrixaceae bacterium]|nr:hypothetical protein [Microthrixaceae bacterium]